MLVCDCCRRVLSLCYGVELHWEIFCLLDVNQLVCSCPVCYVPGFLVPLPVCASHIDFRYKFAFFFLWCNNAYLVFSFSLHCNFWRILCFVVTNVSVHVVPSLNNNRGSSPICKILIHGTIYL